MTNNCNSLLRTDSVLDHHHTMLGLSCSNPTIVIPKQSPPLRERNATPALPHWQDTLPHSTTPSQIDLTKTAVNVLTKIDNLKAVGGDDLPFNLDFYTEVQDLQYLLPALAMEQSGSNANAKFDKLNDALIQLVEDFGLVGFETLAVEDRASMASFLRAIDRATGYVFQGARGTDETGRTLDDEASIWAQAMSDHWAGKMEVRDVQERWIDRREEYDELEKKAWEEEAKLATETPSSARVERAAEKATATGGVSSGDAEEDEMLAEQMKWQEEQQKKGGVPGTKVERKS
jgi:hypothetical protein